MSDFEAYLWVTAGIVLSVLIPFAMAVLKPPPRAEGLGDKAKAWIGYVAKTYGKHAAASLLVGLLALAIAKNTGLELNHWYQGLLTGYVWDSTIEKFFRRDV